MSLLLIASKGSVIFLNCYYLNKKDVREKRENTFKELNNFRIDCIYGKKKHYNADDQIIFPTVEGDILRLARKDAPGHYLEIARNANIITIADVYKLPKEKSGSIVKYSYTLN